MSHRSALLTRPTPDRRPEPAPWGAGALLELVRTTAADERRWLPAVRYDAGRRHWERLPAPDGAELWLLTWLPDQSTDLHDHGPSAAALTVVRGRLEEVRADPSGRRTRADLDVGEAVFLAPGVVHDVGNRSVAPAVSVHAYSPPLSSMSFYDASRGRLRRLRTTATDQPEQA